MRIHLLPVMLLAAACLTGCDDRDHHETVANYISIHDGSVAVHAPGRADADISAAGDLSIADTNVPVSAAQRDLLRHYYSTALALRDHGIATGKAGIATAGQALKSVASGLASGNPDKIDSEVNASAARVKAQAALVCNDLADLRTVQESLAAQLPAFQPYAQIKASEADKCRSGLKADHDSD
ncbi:MAG TPA: hypothetical protein VMV99_00695 [Rhodanobacter sp.]|nr:hypothetical protein [Rhodanobacter sp.]